MAFIRASISARGSWIAPSLANTSVLRCEFVDPGAGVWLLRHARISFTIACAASG